MFNLVMIVGEPCAGKTSLSRSVLSELRDPAKPLHIHDVRGTLYPTEKLLVFGLYDERMFGGTDRLARHTHPQAIKLIQVLARQKSDLTGYAEGNLWANMVFIEDARKAGAQVTVVALEASKSVLDTRHAKRGDDQSEVWLKGRHTSIERLMRASNAIVLPHDTFQDHVAAVQYVQRLLGIPVTIPVKVEDDKVARSGYYCDVCHRTFRRAGAFEAHRTGEYEQRDDRGNIVRACTRRCFTDAEMKAAGFVKSDSYWGRPMNRDEVFA